MVPPLDSRYRFPIAITAALLVAALAGLYWYYQSRGNCQRAVATSYDVHFIWHGALTGVNAVDTRTRKEEPSSQLRKVIRRESADIVQKIINVTHLDAADGSFTLTVSGCSEPYLTTWNNIDIPQLSDFFSAAQTWNVDELRKILKSGINVNARDFRNHTAIMLAATDPRKQLQQHPEIGGKLAWMPNISAIELLVSAGADPNAIGNYGLTPLMLADDSTSQILLRAGADVNARDDFGKTPLMYMAEKGETNAINFLLAKHADVQAQDRNGWTALMYAADRGSIESVKLLLEAGSNTQARNNEGNTVLAIAEDHAKREPNFRRAVDLLRGKTSNKS
jgi:ankyrin repeat protein